MILVDQRLVVEVAAVLFDLVEVVDLAECIAQLIDLAVAQAVKMGTLARLAVAVGIAPRTRVSDLELGEIDHPRAGNAACRDIQRQAAEIVSPATVVDPVGDELDVRPGDALAAPHQRRKAVAVERWLAAQTSNQAGPRAPAFLVAARGLFFRRDHAHAVDFCFLELLEIVPETAGAAVI